MDISSLDYLIHVKQVDGRICRAGYCSLTTSNHGHQNTHTVQALFSQEFSPPGSFNIFEVILHCIIPALHDHWSTWLPHPMLNKWIEESAGLAIVFWQPALTAIRVPKQCSHLTGCRRYSATKSLPGSFDKSLFQISSWIVSTEPPTELIWWNWYHVNGQL